MENTKIDMHLLDDKKHIHFIGVGGSGMFPLVQILVAQGYHVSGSDNNPTSTLELEREMGVDVMLGQRPENLAGADLIVYTAAILKDNPELVAAFASGVPVVERAYMLGLLSRMYPNCICVSGTHGKTTTTSMITQILVDSKLEPTAVIGGKLNAIGGSGCIGKSDVMVCEACEFSDHFLQLDPNISIVLNIDDDHMDYFGTLENAIRSYRTFAEMTDKLLIVNGEDENTQKAIAGLKTPVVTYGWSESCDHWPTNISTAGGGVKTTFDWMHHGEKLATLELNVPGRHNVLNAIAAAIAAQAAGATPEQIAQGLHNFQGVHRRFEVLGVVNGVTIADDYAHHPTELQATLEAAKAMDFRQVWAVFQPFTYSRTALLLDDFARVLPIADRVVMSEIMGSREVNTYNIYTKDLAEKIPGSVWFDGFPEIADYVMAHAQPGDLVITLGCGDVNKCAHMMVDGTR